MRARGPCERQQVGHRRELEQPLDDGRPGLELELEPVPRGVVRPPRHEVQAGRVHERQPAKVQDDLVEARAAELLQLVLDGACRGHVEVTAGRDDHVVALRDDSACERFDVMRQHLSSLVVLENKRAVTETMRLAPCESATEPPLAEAVSRGAILACAGAGDHFARAGQARR
jgi:hypothetical protein